MKLKIDVVLQVNIMIKLIILKTRRNLEQKYTDTEVHKKTHTMEYFCVTMSKFNV